MSIPLTLPTSHSNNLTSSSSVSHNGNNASPHSSIIPAVAVVHLPVVPFDLSVIMKA